MTCRDIQKLSVRDRYVDEVNALGSKTRRLAKLEVRRLTKQIIAQNRMRRQPMGAGAVKRDASVAPRSRVASLTEDLIRLARFDDIM